MRILAVALILAFTTLAGCATEVEDPIANVADPIQPLTDLRASHPAFGYLTNDALPVGDGSKINELVDGKLVWYNLPHVPLPDALTSMEPVAQSPDVRTGGGIAIFGSLGFIGGRGAGPLFVVDLRDAEAPVIIGKADDVPVRDADTILYPDGRLVLISTGGGRDITATDVTDPTNPTLIGKFETSGSNHNIAVVPGTPIVYNSGMDIVDFTNPANPIEKGQWGGDGCHDIAFYLSQAEDKYRAYCAGYANSEIWDIANPLKPSLIIEIPFPGAFESMPGGVGQALHETGIDAEMEAAGAPGHPGFSHLAIVSHDANMLIVGDETGGGAINACDFYADGGEAGTLSGPIGNLYFYDISNETQPILGGHVSPSWTDADPGGSCTAHFGKIVEDTGFLVMAFYSAGIVLVDFRDMYNPVIVDRLDQEGDVWDVWYHQGRLYTGDMERGMDIIDLA